MTRTLTSRIAARDPHAKPTAAMTRVLDAMRAESGATLAVVAARLGVSEQAVYIQVRLLHRAGLVHAAGIRKGGREWRPGPRPDNRWPTFDPTGAGAC
jgi:predicted ArsR family transcriptional regulator